MIIVTAPISLTDVGQPFFPLAWKAKNLGADSYIYSDTHVVYDIKPEHSGMIDKATIEAIVAGGGDVYNMSLFLEIDPNAPRGASTWAEFAASINHIPQEINGSFYIEATDGQAADAASSVIASGLNWFTSSEYSAMLPQSQV